MTPDEEIAALNAEIARQRQQIALLQANMHALEARLSTARWGVKLGALAVLLTVGIGLLVVRSHGAFESQLTYWRECGQACGTVVYGPNGALVNQSAAEQAVTCFAAAYAQCKAAVLTRDVGGTDTSETNTFVVEPWDGGGGCDVGLHDSFGIVGSPTVTTRDVQCTSVASGNGTLPISGCQGFDGFTMP